MFQTGPLVGSKEPGDAVEKKKRKKKKNKDKGTKRKAAEMQRAEPVPPAVPPTEVDRIHTCEMCGAKSNDEAPGMWQLESGHCLAA